MSSDQLQGFFESTMGQIVTVCIVLALFGAILISGKNKKTDVNALVLSAIFVALYVALDQISLFRLPQGGSVTAFSMLAITTCGYLLGSRRGVMAGICAGLVSLIFNPYVIHPVQLLLDYPLAVGGLGFSGLFRKGKYGLPAGYLLARSADISAFFYPESSSSENMRRKVSMGLHGPFTITSSISEQRR